MTKVQQHVEYLCKFNEGRNHEVPHSLDSARDYIRTEFNRHCSHVNETKYIAKGLERVNLHGSNSDNPNKQIYFVAHYDTVLGTPGADDNASSVAAMLYLSENLANSKADIEYVAVDTEEPPFFGTPFMGSYIHANSIKSSSLVIVFEMLGYFNESNGASIIPEDLLQYHHASSHDFLACISPYSFDQRITGFSKRLCESNSFPLLHFPTDDLSLFYYCDAKNYVKNNIPTLLITDTGMLRNPHYHLSSDRPDTLNYEKLESFVDCLSDFLLSLNDREIL